MKPSTTLLLLTLLLFNSYSYGQKEEDNKFRIREHIGSGSLVFVAGAAKGFNETLSHHPDRFFAAFPNASRDWFDPAISCDNKYKNGDPKQGAKFPLSTTLLVAFTDQYHLNNLINRLGITGAIVFHVGGGKKSLGYYIKDFLFHTFCYSAGFSLGYYIWPKK